MIRYNEKSKQFDLLTNQSQLSLGILESGHVVLLYFGSRLPESDLMYVVKDICRASYLADTDSIKDFKLEQYPLIISTYGNPDMRTPSLHLRYPDGSRISDFRYYDYRILTDKPHLDGLPQTFSRKNESETLEIILKEQVTGVKLTIRLTAFQNYDAFTQSVLLENKTNESIWIEKIMSANLDFLTDQLDVYTLSGAWGRENQLKKQKVTQGFQGVDSKRCASGHGQNPFIALGTKNLGKDSGKIWSTNLIYSGNFLTQAEVDMHQNTRLQIGINPFDFEWELSADQRFTTPEVVMIYAENGWNEMSTRYHHFYTHCLISKAFAKKQRPVILNNWEATYFDFNKQKILELAENAKQVGVELFVLDDGWFGERSDDTSSLGDWVPNEDKLGGTLGELVGEINKMGLQFGLWIEPEMISKRSQLFEEHPDWVIKVPNRNPQQVRHQYVLDLTRKEIRDYVVQVISDLLDTYSIDYLKWDMNRNVTDSYSMTLSSKRQKEFSHRYILGLYHILSTVTQKYPEILIESCAGGGGRFDPGMLYYTPQIWTSDDTDAIERLSIQAGTSLIYPPSSMSCHVSAIPNHQVGRETSVETRGIVAMAGVLGYELDLLSEDQKVRDEIKAQIQHYKQYREIYQFGEQIVLDTYDSLSWAWMKKGKYHLIVSYVQVLARPNTVPKRLKLTNILDDKIYQDIQSGHTYSGKELKEIGLSICRLSKDYDSQIWILKQKNK